MYVYRHPRILFFSCVCWFSFIENFEVQFECERAGNTKITSHVLWYLDLVVLFQWGLKSSICHQLS